MVLHLLGKKSWNVYNADNVARVRRDEADVRAREEAQEQRMQDDDAARRLAILRGEAPPALVEAAEPAIEQDGDGRHHNDRSQPRKRRRKGEDETDAEIRHARQDVEAGEHARKTLTRPSKGHGDAPLVDHAGHLQLIPAPDEKETRKQGKNADADATKKRKREEEEQQPTGMRFLDAAGFNSRGVEPWYTSHQDRAAAGLEVQGKDVWGNEDPRRHEREQMRAAKSDPFAAMQQAQRQLKQSERDRESWRRERENDMEALKKDEERREKRSEKKKGKKYMDKWHALDGFMLDGEPTNKEKDERYREKERDGRHRQRRRHRSRSRSRDRRRSRD